MLNCASGVFSSERSLVFQADMREALKELADFGALYDAVITDPPYHLSTVKRFAKEGANDTQTADRVRKRADSFARLAGGFMGVGWDGGDISFDPGTWRAVYSVMKPGAFLLAFGGSRTFDMIGYAIRQAGFVMHPFIAWAYGQGFPKAHNLSRAIDKHLGAKPTVVAEGPTVKRLRPGADQAKRFTEGVDAMWRKLEDRTYTHVETVGTTEEAQQWEGWHYGLQALKPAIEPILCAQKPFDCANGAESILKWGAGAYNIDACRVAVEGGELAGRWPANLAHDGSVEVLACFPETPGQLARARTDGTAQGNRVYGPRKHMTTHPEPRKDSGSAARFFNECPFTDDERALLYHAKANAKDRIGSTHPTVKSLALMRHLCRLIVPPGGTVLDPFAGTGTTLKAAEAEGFYAVGIEGETQYFADIERRLCA